MALRHSLLAVLTLGPAYGYQLHGEVVERTRRDSPLNVGQVYATLDRLRRDGLIEDAGTTSENLPLYRLTTAGEVEAHMHLTEPDTAEWHDMIERVLLARSLPGDHLEVLLTNYRRLWAPRPRLSDEVTDPSGGTAHQAAQHAAHLLRTAALTWIDALPPGEPWPLRRDRRRRGRRAAAVAHP